MPQVRSRTVRFDGKSYVRKTTVDKDGVFHIRLPMAARDILKCDEISAPTLKEVEKLWDEKMGKYKSARTIERKVIYYRIQCNSSEYEGEDISFCDGVALAVAAQVLTETKGTYSDGKKSYSYRVEKSSLPDSMTRVDRSFHGLQNEDPDCMIDWTPEREAFFKQVGEAIDQLIVKLDSVLNNRERLLEIIDSGARVLEFRD